jgi:hypothetical protein
MIEKSNVLLDASIVHDARRICVTKAWACNNQNHEYALNGKAYL